MKKFSISTAILNNFESVTYSYPHYSFHFLIYYSEKHCYNMHYNFGFLFSLRHHMFCYNLTRHPITKTLVDLKSSFRHITFKSALFQNKLTIPLLANVRLNQILCCGTWAYSTNAGSCSCFFSITTSFTTLRIWSPWWIYWRNIKWIKNTESIHLWNKKFADESH